MKALLLLRILIVVVGLAVVIYSKITKDPGVYGTGMMLIGYGVGLMIGASGKK